MTLERILEAALNSMLSGKRQPHCFSSFIKGVGYTGKYEGDNKIEYLKQLEKATRREIDNIGFASDYCEPGYDSPKKGVVMANWNVFPSNIDDILERAGYSLEWSDEWTICGECGKAVRTSPDSYCYTPHYKIVNECELICLDCLKEKE